MSVIDDIIKELNSKGIETGKHQYNTYSQVKRTKNRKRKRKKKEDFF